MKLRPVFFACFLSLLLWQSNIHAQTTAPVSLPAKFALPANPIELTRAARPREYFEAIGRKSAILGHESGVFEAWAFPMKLFHDARLSILVEGQDNAVAFADCVERIITRPEATTLVASNQLFTIRAHFLSPIDETASLVLLDVDAARPLTITVSFIPDLKPMWPAGMGGQAAGWRDDLKAFVISESRRKYNAFFGSPAATRGVSTPAHQLGAGALRFDIKVNPQIARKHFYPLIIAAGGSANDKGNRQAVIDLYNRIAASVPQQYQKTFDHYRHLREEMMSIETPDEKLNLAFEWAKASLDKGMIDNPDLGLGLVAGWGTTGEGARPGFGWFFGGDAAINSYAMTAYGDFESVKATFRFLAKFQRADGKIPHEISQSAALIKWFEEYPYAYIHADTTPLFIAAVGNYYQQSGDVEFIKELWPVLKKSYQFCIENDSDGDGILENSKAGLGASELGSLREDVHQDIYLAATNHEASAVMKELARVMNDDALAMQARERENKAYQIINTRYWNASENRYAYALTKTGKQNLELTAWQAVPMIFGQLDPQKARGMLTELASAQLSTDWGVRMLSNRSSAYDPIAYNNGGVWPFLTGFVAAAEYQYHRSHSAFAHLQQLAGLTFDFALGYHPEILSGDYYRPLDESVPHQLFSSGMVITPLVRGLLGLRPDSNGQRLVFAPQLPPTWQSLKIRNFRFDDYPVDLYVTRESDSTFRIFVKGGDNLRLKFAPSFPALTKILKVTDKAEPFEFKIEYKTSITGDAVVCTFETITTAYKDVRIFYEGKAEIDVPITAPQTGDSSQSLRVIDFNQISNDRFEIRFQGKAGKKYLFGIRDLAPVLDHPRIYPMSNSWFPVELLFPDDDGAGEWRTKTFTFGLKPYGLRQTDRK